MGGAISRFLKNHSEPKSIEVSGTIFEDPRSPSASVNRTPIVHEKKPYLETDIDNIPASLPLRVKMLRKAIDPRSPTVGINRTPIALLQTPTNGAFESPVSLYSNYQTDTVSLSCLQSPPEPSVNVSDFEERFSQELDSLVKELDRSMSDSESPSPQKPTQLQFRPEKSLNEKLENKKMCESLIQEIIDSFKEFEDEIKVKSDSFKDEIKVKSKPKFSNKKLSCDRENLDVTPVLKKNRKPLSNITSAGNTPTKYQNLNKDKKDGKLVSVDFLGENSPVPVGNSKIRVQWDDESTVLI